MNRRSLIKAALAGSAALILPPTLAENAEAVERRFWFLDRTHYRPGVYRVSDFYRHNTTDDQAIAAAIAAAKRGGGGTVEFDSKEYWITRPAVFNADRTRYEGNGACLVRAPDVVWGILFDVLEGSHINNIGVRGDFEGGGFLVHQ